MVSVMPLSLGNEYYTATMGDDCLLDHDDILGRFPKAPQMKLSSYSSLQPQYPADRKRHEQVEKYLVAPCENMEWKTTLGEIKREYVNRRFRQCSTRCQEVLALGDKLNPHPIHLVYVRFYAATALEMQARAMHHSSPSRATLLRQAYTHYSVASDLAGQADEQVSSSSHTNLGRFSLSSLHSPAGSNVSDSTTSTRMSSPTPSLGAHGDVFKPTPKKKKVAFRDEPIVEPFIRPDSPTLGYDDWLGRYSPEPVLPESILKSVKHAPTPMAPSDDALHSFDASDMDEDLDTDPFFHERSVHRFCTILASIRRQIAYHLTTLDIEIAACQIPTAPVDVSDEMRALDIQARIERLRACGWRRPRFNAQRYEALRENALADIAE